MFVVCIVSRGWAVNSQKPQMVWINQGKLFGRDGFWWSVFQSFNKNDLTKRDGNDDELALKGKTTYSLKTLNSKESEKLQRLLKSHASSREGKDAFLWAPKFRLPEGHDSMMDQTGWRSRAFFRRSRRLPKGAEPQGPSAQAQQVEQARRDAGQAGFASPSLV